MTETLVSLKYLGQSFFNCIVMICISLYFQNCCDSITVIMGTKKITYNADHFSSVTYMS